MVDATALGVNQTRGQRQARQLLTPTGHSIATQ
jgi:hypothetical protein